MRLEKFKQPIDRLLAGFTVAVMAMLVVCVVWQVFSRYVLAQPSTMTDEIARFSMIWVGLLGAAYATGKRRHLSIDLFVSDLTGGRRLANQLFLDISPLLFRIAEPLHILLKQFFQLKQTRSAVTMADNGQPAEILRRGFHIEPCLSAVF